MTSVTARNLRSKMCPRTQHNVMHRSSLSSHVVRCGFDCHSRAHSYFYIQLLLSRDVACHTDYLETNTVATRLSLKTLLPHFTSEGMYFPLRVHLLDVVDSRQHRF